MRLQRPSHATVIAYLALFIALSGTAIAAKKIGSDGLKKGAVTTKKIADGSVSTSKIKDDAVTGAKLDNGAVGEGKLAADAVTAGKLAPNSVGTNKIRDEAVESAKIANGAVTEGKIGNNAVTGSKVADGSLSLAKLAQLVVNVDYAPGSVAGNSCATSSTIAVPGLTAGDDVLVLTRDSQVAWPSSFMLDGYGPTGNAAGEIIVRVCNITGGPITPPPLGLVVLGFR